MSITNKRAMELLDEMKEPYCEEENEALNMAISALAKATKKRPEMRHVKPYDSYNDGWCPCCEAYVQEYEYDTFFCQRCGQALNWNEEECQ